jgi:ABC-type nitrate/sulfonate/bicarbonate transport system substrate-binding protein
MAKELDLFSQHGVAVELTREVGWATVRDKIIYGEIDAAQAPAGMVIAASAGLGSVEVKCLTGLIIGLHGNAITLSQRLWRAGVRDGAGLRREIQRRGRAARFVFGAVFSQSSHHYLLRTWLRTHGIDPDHDVRIAIVPPPQMYSNMAAGHLDGYCVGEPWNSAAVRARVGFVVATSRELANRHPEKVLMVRSEFAERRKREHLALIAALAEACRFCEAPANRERIAEILAGSRYLNTPVQVARRSLAGPFLYGNGRSEVSPDFHVFAGHDANEPTAEKADWVMKSVLATSAPDARQALDRMDLRQMFRADLYREAIREAAKTFATKKMEA